jgi:mannose-6-phosphate isomerase-like protein (cupin superfamily)
MLVGDETRRVGPGDAVYIPKGHRHSLRNDGVEPIRLLLVCGPAFYYEDEVMED